MQALSDPLVFYGFDELKEECLLQRKTANHNDKNPMLDEEDMNHSSLVHTLDLFAYGTFQDYHLQQQQQQQHHDENNTLHDDPEQHQHSEEFNPRNMNPLKYMKLTDTQIWKLKALSVITILEVYTKSIRKGKGSQSPPPPRKNNTSTSNPDTGTDIDHHTISYLNQVTIRSRPRRTNLSHSHTSLASSCRTIPYDVFQKSLLLDSTAQLEELLLHCIYSNLLPHGTKLDPKHECLELGLVPPTHAFATTSTSIMTKSSTTTTTTSPPQPILPLSRDVPMKDIPYMMDQLKELLQRGIHAQQHLEQSMHVLQDTSRKEHDDWNLLRRYLSTMELSAPSSSSLPSSSTQLPPPSEQMVPKSSLSYGDSTTCSSKEAWWKDTLASERHGKRSKGDDGNLL